jgi:hypothetical protein
MRRFLLVLLLVSAAGAAEEGGAPSAEAEFHLAQALERMGFSFSAFTHYAAIVSAGPANPYYLKAIDAAASAAERLRDDVVAPNLFEKAYGEPLSALAPQSLARIRTSLALLGYRAGRFEQATRLAEQVPPGTAAYPQAQYLKGLLQERTDPQNAAATFRALAALPGAGGELKELAWIALGRTLYALHRYEEASAAYGNVPRFSRHWDEALFEGAYADLQKGDPGGALGKLHSLQSPHLSDEFVPESLNLMAILYQQRCLYRQVREVLAQFDSEYLPMRDQINELLRSGPALEEYWRMLQPADARLPRAVQRHLQKNERVASMRAYLATLDQEASRVRANPGLNAALKEELLDGIARQKQQSERLAGKFIQGRLADMARLIEVLEGDKELIDFETTKGEKEMLETRFDADAQLASQQLRRPGVPRDGQEYWPFDGEYWPDEIGYYRYTVKDACAGSKDE